MYRPTIGLEIHVELKTKTKMFCGCLNNPDEKQPNINVCPVCLAHPGALPTINKKAVEAVLKLGLALDGKIPTDSKFDRKNYFYPDLPKGYQISQYDKPLVLGGKLNGVRLTRIHLEEDTARLLHSTQLPNYPITQSSVSLVDFNRAGIPLMELVTEPEIKSGKEAVGFAKELQLILRYLEISDADMEKGHMRIEANLSLSADHNLGTKVEVKNINSFRATEEAIDYEIKRQTEVLEKGEKVVQETRGWNENKKITVSQRLKEEAHDYRYFPEPDLPLLNLTEFDFEKLKIEMPELPEQKRIRFSKEYGLSPEQAEILVVDRRLAEYFEESASELFSEISEEKNKRENIQLLFNYLTSDLKGLLNEKGLSVGDLKISPENFTDLIVLIIKGELSSRLAKDVLREMAESGLDPRQIIKEKGMNQISDEKVIEQAVGEVIAQNGKAVEDYRKGKESAVQFLIGQSMKKSGGRANPQKIKEIIDRLLKRLI
ncbi:Asp-tRNA(Asn)/Glu-tRNA(Gln) amidotransferase subunit GatB [Candidatus Wolfebacteria bacterium]|nr:Asp-tRNA(Asn)/Glu-tRNA(Gln) amidotransferase subunit GatB [Candidatus Wolfebacteria bacterium]